MWALTVLQAEPAGLNSTLTSTLASDFSKEEEEEEEDISHFFLFQIKMCL